MLSSLFGIMSSAEEDTSKQILNSDNINKAVQLCKYDVRGEIYLAAVTRAQEGKEVIYTNVGNPHAVGESPISFTRQVLSLVRENTAAVLPDAQRVYRALNHQLTSLDLTHLFRPLSFSLSLTHSLTHLYTLSSFLLCQMMSPPLLQKPNISSLFPTDAIARAKLYLQHFKGGIGAYTDSRGNAHVRQEVADFITRRDNVPADANNIFLSNGASEVIVKWFSL